jgi:hypothetical protein
MFALEICGEPKESERFIVRHGLRRLRALEAARDPLNQSLGSLLAYLFFAITAHAITAVDQSILRVV